jgi:hypothetical protein
MKPKYKLGQKVWYYFRKHNNVCSGTISKVSREIDKITYSVGGYILPEEILSKNQSDAIQKYFDYEIYNTIKSHKEEIKELKQERRMLMKGYRGVV